jgi:uncharacterized SAM-binding protein YcdF (DUF218 family)
VVFIPATAFVFFALGSFLAKEDPLERADAIFVFAGTSMERPLEAADLYLAGFARTIVLTYETEDEAVSLTRRRGVAYPARANLERDALIRLGIPAQAILLPPRAHDNTAQEADTLRELATDYGWQRVIAVTSKFHLRRAGFAARRALRGTGVRVVMHGSRYDLAVPSRWWARRRDVRFVTSEAAKLVAYAFGLGA